MGKQLAMSRIISSRKYSTYLSIMLYNISITIYTYIDQLFKKKFVLKKN